MNFKVIVVGIILSLLCIACGDDEPQTPAKSKRTILVYMIVTNNLGSKNKDELDIKEMEDAITKYGTNDCRILIFRTTYTTAPTLFELKKTDKGEVLRIELKQYDRGTKATTPTRMRQVINDVADFAPAYEYGLILWSHATGWAKEIPTNNTYLKSYDMADNGILVRSFGNDNGEEMQLHELEEALPDQYFSFIYADVCYMASIEVIYQLRNKTNYFIASPTIVPGDGMPYNLTLPLFFYDIPDYQGICDKSYEYYMSQREVMRSFTISVTDCSSLDDLASVVNGIYSCTNEIENTDDIQKYVAKSDGKCIFFDFGQYISYRITDSNSTLLNLFYNKLNDCVIYKKSTPKIYNELEINPEHFSGLSVYIPGTGGVLNENYYKTLDWYNIIH